MANFLYISLLNPVNFYEINPTELPQYLSRTFDEYPFDRTIQPWEESVKYCQKFQRSDIIYLQFISNFDPIAVTVVDIYGQSLMTFNALKGPQDKDRPGYFAYEVSISLDDYAKGVYYIKLLPGGSTALMISEPIFIQDIHPNTLYLQYKNSRPHAGSLPTGSEFNFRIEGSIGHVDPSSIDQFYDDQRLNPTVLSSKPFDNFPLSIGGSYGVPDWVIQKINYIFSCNSVRIDGKYFAKTSDSKFSINEEENYPLRAVEFKIRPGINRGYKVISPEIDTNQRLIVVHNINGRLFGDLSENASSTVIQITDIE